MPSGSTHVIFVVVLFSVVVQGGLVPTVARPCCKVRMREVEPEPWALGMRLARRARGRARFVVERGSAADGARIADLHR